MKKLIVVLALAVPMFANPALFSKYEAVRQGLLAGSLRATRASAKTLADVARAQKNVAIAKRAIDVANAADLDEARAAFAPLSDEMIKLRNASKGARPAVATCPMLKKSWLQPKGEIGNPYNAEMAKCGEIRD